METISELVRGVVGALAGLGLFSLEIGLIHGIVRIWRWLKFWQGTRGIEL